MAHVIVVSSWVAHGHVGLCAATPVLQALGHGVTQLPTVQLSNHAGWPHVSGAAVEVGTLKGMVDALDRNGWLDGADAILTGYLPSAVHVGFAADLIDRLRAVVPGLRCVVDPVLGDAPKGLYIAPEAAGAIRDLLLPRADLVTPNLFELSWLSGQAPQTLAEARDAALELLNERTAAVLVTSPPAGPDSTGILAVERTSAALPPHRAGGIRAPWRRRCLLRPDRRGPASGGGAGASAGAHRPEPRRGAPAHRRGRAPLDIRDSDRGGPLRPIDRHPRNGLRWGMAFDFILMLTENDRTIPDARARLDEALEGGVRHIGFKDVGLPVAELRALATAIREAGGRSYLEVVSLDAESEMASARAAVDLDVDVLLGGTRAEEVTAITRHHPVRYYPFPGRITGHPSVLEGPESEIVASARALAALEHVHGLDLLAYRYAGDVPQLMSAVSAAVSKPVIVAGSIDSATGGGRRDSRRAGVHGGHRRAGRRLSRRDRGIRGAGTRHPRHHRPGARAFHRTPPHRAGGP
jgi:pyridoxal/pyridoxine/pyridoxamine kinase